MVAGGEEKTTSQILIDALTKRGMRSTAPRRLLVELISSVPDTFTAEEICCLVPDIGRATVYRTLKLLLDAGAVCKLVMPNGEMAYSLSESETRTTHDDHHHHVVCTVCGSVRLLALESIERAIEALNSSHQLGSVVDHRIEVYDVCPTCLKAV